MTIKLKERRAKKSNNLEKKLLSVSNEILSGEQHQQFSPASRCCGTVFPDDTTPFPQFNTGTDKDIIPSSKGQ